MEKEKKMSFWQKVVVSIKDFENYQELAAEKVQTTIGYLFKLILIFSIIIAMVMLYKFSITIGNVKQYIDDEIQTISYENNKLSVISKNTESTNIILQDNETTTKLIIDTQIETEEEKNERIEEIKSYNNGVLLLNDRLVIKNDVLSIPSTYYYKDISSQYNINITSKEEVINLLSTGPAINSVYALVFVYSLILYFVIYFSTALVDAIMLALLGYISSKMARLNLKLSAIYNIAVHALTLPIILNILYFVINAFTGFNIKYFSVMYTTIAYIYVITAILMIKSDFIKRQMELTKILEEQQKVREELAKKEQERKEQEEKERLKKEDEKKQEEKKKKQTKPDIKVGQEPEGENA